MREIKNVGIDGASIYAERQGSGPDLVLVHGMGQSSAQVWRLLVSDLAQHFTVLTYDQRGHTRSTDQYQDQSVKRHASDLLALLDYFGIDQAHIVGFSFGGLVVQEAALSRPDYFLSLILVGTTCGVLPETFEDYLKRADMIEEKGLASYVDQAVIRVLSARFIQTQPVLVAEYRAQFLADDPKAYAGVMRAIVAWRSCERLGQFDRPVLIMAGTEDDSPMSGYVPLKAAEELHRLLKSSKLAAIPEVKHYVQLEKPDVFIKTLIGFISQVAAAAA